MTPEELFNYIQNFCRASANPENVIKYSRYFRGEYNAWGLSLIQMNDLVKQLIETEGVILMTVVNAMPLLMKSEKNEETTIGLLLINKMKKQYSVQLFREISGWFSKGITNWAQADTLGMWILPSLIEKGHVKENDFKPWLKSAFSFQRRCVPVTYIKSLKKMNSPQLLFSIIEPLMTDNVREVQQGTGWFLREAWKLFPEKTEQFLMKWKDSAPRLIYQYACEKMNKDYRKQFSRKKT